MGAPLTGGSSDPVCRNPDLPILVFCTIQPRDLRFGKHIESVLSAPGVCGWIVLHGAKAPFRAIGHRIGGNVSSD